MLIAQPRFFRGYLDSYMANAVNPISIIVPCHRVIAATGHLTGYSGGLDKKRGLLMLEAEYSRADLACAKRWIGAPSN
ncbi:methylated-DNA--[protein]-cysteine S-methyltransferase [Pseudomonas aegrilactucae]